MQWKWKVIIWDHNDHFSNTAADPDFLVSCHLFTASNSIFQSHWSASLHFGDLVFL